MKRFHVHLHVDDLAISAPGSQPGIDHPGIQTDPAACCAPTPRGKPIGIPIKSSTSCC